MSCNCDYWKYWKFNHSKSENLQNLQDYLKSNDIINLSNDAGKNVILRSHDVQFTIGNDTFQEVVCHNERLGGNDEVNKLIDIIVISYLLFICMIFFSF